MITEGGNITNRVKGGVSEVHQRFLFLGDADGESGGEKLRYWLENNVLLKSMSITVNIDNSIRLNVHMKADRPETLEVAQRLASLECQQEISQRRRL